MYDGFVHSIFMTGVGIEMPVKGVGIQVSAVGYQYSGVGRRVPVVGRQQRVRRWRGLGSWTSFM